MAGLNINGGVIKGSRRHLAGDHSLPDELVELELGIAQICFEKLRLAVYLSGADGFMCLLRSLDRPGEGAGVGGEVLVAVLPGDELSRLGNSRAGDPRGVGAHVGDKAHGAFFADG